MARSRPAGRSSRPGSLARRSSSRARSLGVERVEHESVDAVADGLGEPAESRHDSGTRAARHSAAASGAQSHHIDGSTTTSTSRSSPPISDGANAPDSSDDAAAIECAQLLGEPLRHLAEDPHVELARASAAPPRPAAAAPCAGRPSRGRRPSAARRSRPGARRSADLLPDLGLVRHRLAHDVEQVGCVAGPEQRAPHGVGYGQDRGQAGVGAGADLGEPPPVAGLVVAADARRAVGAVARGPDRSRPRRSAGRRAGRSASSCGS